jgi:hypothetical protein
VGGSVPAQQFATDASAHLVRARVASSELKGGGLGTDRSELRATGRLANRLCRACPRRFHVDLCPIAKTPRETRTLRSTQQAFPERIGHVSPPRRRRGVDDLRRAGADR